MRKDNHSRNGQTSRSMALLMCSCSCVSGFKLAGLWPGDSVRFLEERDGRLYVGL